MSVKIRPYRNGGWEIDIRVVTPDGTRQLRERRRAPVSSRSVAMRWAEGRERTLFQRLVDPTQHKARKEVPTLRAFAPRFLDGHSRANRQKPSGIAAKEMILRVHLVPALGHKRLDAIKSEDVQRLKRNLEAKSPKTVNNVLAVLSAAEESGRVGSHRAHAVRGEAPAGDQGLDQVLRLRRVRTARRSGTAPRPTHPSHRAVGR